MPGIAMNTCHVYSLVSIGSFVLLVFYNETWSWQFRIISGSAVFGERKLYFSAQAAEKAAREWIGAGS